MKKKNGAEDNAQKNSDNNVKKLSNNGGFGIGFNVDPETAATVSAQCLEFKVTAEEFLSVAVRLFIDFKYIAEVIGLDIFSMRDELIKAIVKSLGDDADDGNADKTAAAADKNEAENGIENPADNIGSKIERISGLLNNIKQASNGENTGNKGVSARLEVQSNKIDTLNIELSEIKAMMFDLKNSIESGGSVKNKSENLKNNSKNEIVKENNQRSVEPKNKKMEIQNIVSEIKAAHTASYKEKRRKLDKLKF